jgi:long-chain acyl-CoA synthetase
MMRTLTDLLESFFDRGESSAFVFRTGVRRRAMTYFELYRAALKTAAFLERKGVGPGDRVILWGPNSPWWGVAFWGIVARGAVAVPVDFMSGKERAETIAELTSATFAFQSRFKADRLEREGALLEDLEFLIEDEEMLPAVAASPDDLAELVYTSGTTGNPKGVMLTHGNLAANLLQVSSHIEVVTDGFRFLSVLPLSHMFEQTCGFLTPLYRGASVIYIRTIKPSAIMSALSDENVHVVVLVPRLLRMLRSSIEREFESRGLRSLLARGLALGERLSRGARRILFLPVQKKFGRNFTLFVSGGAPLDPDLGRFWDAMGFRVVEGYGLTECSPVVTAGTFEKQVFGSAGKPLPGVELRIENEEIHVRGENVFPGYYCNPEATREALRDGWFRTGDRGRIEDGWLYIRGRSKEMIVTGAGINVYPDEIEEVLNRTPGVRESCVVGIDRGDGETVHAVLIPDGSGRRAEEIVGEANRSLDALHKINGFSVWPEPEFPKTTTLKIRKFQVKERIVAGGAEGAAGGTFDRLVELVSRVTGASPREVREEASLVTDLGLTSIGRLELVNYLEQEYRVDLEDSLIGPETTLAELRRIIDRREKLEISSRFRFWTNGPCVRGIRKICDLLLNGPLFRLFVTLDVRGVENLANLPEPVLFTSNHLSYFDQPAVMFALPEEIRYRTATAAWEEFFFKNYRNPAQHLWKRFTYEYGTIGLNIFPLPQSSGFRRSLYFMGKLADRGINVLIFPEGERSRTGKLLPFQPGLGLMVKELGVPVVPVRIVGMEKVYPRGAIFPRQGRVTVVFGEPARYRMETPQEIVADAERRVGELRVRDEV